MNNLFFNNSVDRNATFWLKQGACYVVRILPMITSIVTLALPVIALINLPGTAAETDNQPYSVTTLEVAREEEITTTLQNIAALGVGLLNSTALLGFLALQREEQNKNRDAAQKEFLLNQNNLEIFKSSLAPINPSEPDNLEEFKPTAEKELEASVLLENFRKELTWITFHADKPDQNAEKLLKIIPPNSNPQDILDIIFQKHNEHSILFQLNAFRSLYPLFTPSSYNQIRWAIVEDKNLTNDSLMTKLKEYQLDVNEKILEELYDFAYLINQPHIYPLAKNPVSTDEYNLNFFWVNLNPQNRIQNTAKNIFNDGSDPFENAEELKNPNVLSELEKMKESLEGEALINWQNIKNTFTYKLSKWADANPGAQMNLWYDSALVTQQAQKQTFEMISEIAQSRKVDLRLRDIRILPNIEGEIQLSLHPATPIYYRVDLLKALITDYMMSSPEEKSKYCVISDIDVEPMPQQQLFDQRTLNYLSSYGYVFHRYGFSAENDFLIFNKDKEDIQKIHHETVIQYIEYLINEQRNYEPNGSEYELGAQCVYNRYRPFREGMHEPCSFVCRDVLVLPRKIVKSPQSRFHHNGKAPLSSQINERFRFIGERNTPYTLNGRNPRFDGEWSQLPKLVDWKVEPLTFSSDIQETF